MNDSGGRPDELDDAHRSASAGMPRWVKVFAAIGLILLVLLIVGLIAGGHHGPGRHFGSGGATFAEVAAASALQAPAGAPHVQP